MRILWHSNSPFMKSGYGIETAMVVPRIRALGHEVAISSFGGGSYGHITEFDGCPVLPSGEMNYGNDVLAAHYREWDADLLITLCDPWALDPAQFEGMRVAPWMPCDTEPLSELDKWWIGQATAAGAEIVPVAMTRFGERMLRAAGFEPLYVPHSVDTGVFYPDPEAGSEWRAAHDVPAGAWLAVMNANNKGVPSRKAFAEQFQGFARFAARHRKAALYVHSRTVTPDGLHLPGIVDSLGLAGRVMFADPYQYSTGRYQSAYLRGMYSAAQVVSNCSMAEGFGLPIVESLACGTPVVATRGSAMTELVPHTVGWLVDGDRWWVHSHSSYWVQPHVTSIAAAYERAYTGAPRKAPYCAAVAARYGIGAVAEKYWKSALDLLS